MWLPLSCSAASASFQVDVLQACSAECDVCPAGKLYFLCVNECRPSFSSGLSLPLWCLFFLFLFHLLSFPLTVKAAYYNLYSRVLLEGDIWWPHALLQQHRRKSELRAATFSWGGDDGQLQVENLSTFQKVADGVITDLCQATSQRVDWSRLVTCLHGNRDDREEACSGNFYNRDRKVLLEEQIIRTLLVIVGLLSLYVSLFFTVVSPLLP